MSDAETGLEPLAPRFEALAALERGQCLDRLLNNLCAAHGCSSEEAREAVAISLARAARRASEA